MAPKTEEERKNEEAASRRHARLDNAGILHMSANSGEVHEKVSILPGYEPNYTSCTFCLWEEDHTLGNALRWMLMKDPNVEYCGYSAPHPSEPKIHIRVQMYDNLSAVDALRKALAGLRDLFTTIDTRYAQSLKGNKYVREDDVDVHQVVAETLRSRGFGVEGDEMDESA